MDTSNYISLCVCLTEILYVFGIIFIECEIGHHLSSEFDSINDAVYELDWNSYPDNIKRMMPIILQVTLEPVELSAYGNYACSRETFKRVIEMNTFGGLNWKDSFVSLYFRCAIPDILSSPSFENLSRSKSKKYVQVLMVLLFFERLVHIFELSKKI